MEQINRLFGVDQEQVLSLLEAIAGVPVREFSSEVRPAGGSGYSGADKQFLTLAYTTQDGVSGEVVVFAQDLHARGELGNLTFLRGTYYQDLEGDYPLYWRAQPPMHYATHAVVPLLALAQARATRVCCFGSGRLRPDLHQPGGNTFPLETAIFQLGGTGIAAEVTRSWFQTARAYTEAFSVYGDRAGFEWQQLEHEDPLLFALDPVQPGQRGRGVAAVRVHVPDRMDLLPGALADFTKGGHGGSHPHLAHEFIRSIVEERPPAIDALTSAEWTAPGICAHESAIRGGEPVDVPDFAMPVSGHGNSRATG